MLHDDTARAGRTCPGNGNTTALLSSDLHAIDVIRNSHTSAAAGFVSRFSAFASTMSNIGVRIVYSSDSMVVSLSSGPYATDTSQHISTAAFVAPIDVHTTYSRDSVVVLLSRGPGIVVATPLVISRHLFFSPPLLSAVSRLANTSPAVT